MSQSERKHHIQPSAKQDVGELCHAYGYHPHMSSLHQQRSDKVHDFVKSFNLAYNKAVKFADPCRQDASQAKDASHVPRCMGKGNNEHDVCYTAKLMCMLQAKWVALKKSRLHSVAIC